MNDETWGQDTFSYNAVNEGTFILINGANVPVEPGANFRDTIKNASLDAGMGKYRVLLNGVEIRPSEAPVAFAQGDKVEVRAYDAAGLCQ